MSPEHVHLIDGIRFSDGFCRELRRIWAQLGDDGPKTVADVQRTGRLIGNEESMKHWAIHFVPREIVAPKDIVMIDNHPVHIQSSERKLLQGKVLDFKDHLFVVR
jgi:hypothetical protein